MSDDRVILSEEPGQVKISVQDPNKPKQGAGGKMITRKQKVPFLDRVIGAFFGADVDRSNVGEHILNDFAVPVGKRMVNNAVQGSLKRIGDASQVMLFGKVVSSSNGPTDYTSFSNPNGQPQRQQGAYRVMDSVEVFAFRDKNSAIACLNYLRGRIREYGSASAVDYFEWINSNLNMDIPLDYNMTYRGWVDLSNVTITPDPNGFIINLPRPVGLK